MLAGGFASASQRSTSESLPSSKSICGVPSNRIVGGSAKKKIEKEKRSSHENSIKSWKNVSHFKLQMHAHNGDFWPSCYGSADTKCHFGNHRCWRATACSQTDNIRTKKDEKTVCEVQLNISVQYLHLTSNLASTDNDLAAYDSWIATHFMVSPWRSRVAGICTIDVADHVRLLPVSRLFICAFSGCSSWLPVVCVDVRACLRYVVHHRRKIGYDTLIVVLCKHPCTAPPPSIPIWNVKRREETRNWKKKQLLALIYM